MSLAEEKRYTVEDIYALPEGERAELIDGEMYMLACPTRIHQEISGEIAYWISAFIRSNHGECKVYQAPFAVFLDEAGFNYVEPDVSVICDKNKLNDRGCVGAPDWVIEIVSPSSKRMDYLIKMLKYRAAGVREYWIVDPADRSIFLYDFTQDDLEKHTFDDSVTSRIFPGLSISLAAI